SPRTFASLQELTKLPWGSNSMTGGALIRALAPSNRSLAVSIASVNPSCRCKTNTWSRASIHAPPNGPTTQLSGSLAQKGSTSYLGTELCARTGGGQKTTEATTHTTHVPPMMRYLVFARIFNLTFKIA